VPAHRDYSQIELRIMAHLSGDAALLGRSPPGTTSRRDRLRVRPAPADVTVELRSRSRR
jgi:hypothetical protein